MNYEFVAKKWFFRLCWWPPLFGMETEVLCDSVPTSSPKPTYTKTTQTLIFVTPSPHGCWYGNAHCFSSIPHSGVGCLKSSNQESQKNKPKYIIMDIKRIIPNISCNKMDESKAFYVNFLGLHIVMDMHWVVTFASPSNPTAQINIVQSDKEFLSNDHVTITMEVADVDDLYEKAQAAGYEITYPITNEPWGPVRRFWVKDPNGITVNLMAHREA